MFWKDFLEENRKKKKCFPQCFVNAIWKFASACAKMAPRQHLPRTMVHVALLLIALCVANILAHAVFQKFCKISYFSKKKTTTKTKRNVQEVFWKEFVNRIWSEKTFRTCSCIDLLNERFCKYICIYTHIEIKPRE